MTKDEAAKVFAIKYILDYNTFLRNARMREDLLQIRRLFFDDDEFLELWEKYNQELREAREIPRWTRLIMAERYSINI